METLTTTQELTATRELYRGQRIPKPALAVMDAGTDELAAGGLADRAPKPGDTAPDFLLPRRIAEGAALNPYDRGTFYGGAERGYTDYAPLVGEEAA